MRLFGNKIIQIFTYIAILAFLFLFMYLRHQDAGYFNWRSRMWGDPAGYYIYLPATFIFGFDGSRLPEGIVESTGEGFVVNEEGKIITRYSYGVAFMQLPFFAAVHFLAGITGQEQDGFSGMYHLVSGFAAVIYSFLGMVILWIYLLTYFKKKTAFISLIIIYLGTNLLYYTIDATGMSHVYSFFLFSLLLLVSKSLWIQHPQLKSSLYYMLFVLVSALIVLIRPTNFVFVVLVFMLNTTSWSELKIRLREVLYPSRIIAAVGVLLIVFFPQMIYWNYASGSYLMDSYEGYGFSNLTSPQIIHFLFSTNNGLFTYNPVYFVIFYALFFMIFKKQTNGYYILGAFLLLIYLYSSWFIFSFGCGYGSRNFVEYTAIFSLPLSYLFEEVSKHSKRIKTILSFFIVLFVLINLKLVSAYDKCFMGNDWDIKEYSYFLQRSRYTKRMEFSESALLTPTDHYSESIRVDLNKIALVNYRRALISIDVDMLDQNTEALVVMTIASNDSTIYWNAYPLIELSDCDQPGKAQRIQADFWLPRYFTTDSEIVSYIWNIGGDSLKVFGMRIYLK